MTGGMMGRTSDTRIYNPRSESSEMFRANHEDESPPRGVEDGNNKDRQQDKRQAKREDEEKEDKEIRHIKVRGHHGGKKKSSIDEEEEDDDSTKLDADREVGLETTPANTGGFLTSLATGAKGPGAAAGEAIQMSEPMAVAWQLLKAPPVTTLYSCGLCKNIYDNEQYANECCGQSPSFWSFEERVGEHTGKDPNRRVETGEPMDIAYQLLKALPQDQVIPRVEHLKDNEDIPHKESWDRQTAHPAALGMARRQALKRPLGETRLYVTNNNQWDEDLEGNHYEEDMEGNRVQRIQPGSPQEELGDPMKGEPMDIVWQLLKNRVDEKRRKAEMHSKWRPSTGQFQLPPGGGSPRTATTRRSKTMSRNLPMGKKSGLMLPHLAVEMSHRGLASKQPMSKDPQKYRQYLAQQDARKLLGNVRSTPAPHLRHSQRSFSAGPTGAGRLSGTLRMPQVPRPRLHAVRAPSIVPPKMHMPRLAKPKIPGMVSMSDDSVPKSDILKAVNHYHLAELRNIMREMRQIMREKRDKDNKEKGYGNPDTSGAASNLPNYASNNPKQTTRPEGGTEDENESRLWGLSPQDLVGRGSNRA